MVPEKFLDLCSFILAHRFSSPKWLKVLAAHVSAADSSLDDLYEKVCISCILAVIVRLRCASQIVSLRTGEAIMFAPNGLVVRGSPPPASASGQTETGVGPNRDASSGRSPPVPEVMPLGQGYLLVRSRLRVSRDGGHSILAVNDPSVTTRFGRVPLAPVTPDELGQSTSSSTSAISHTLVEDISSSETEFDTCDSRSELDDTESAADARSRLAGSPKPPVVDAFGASPDSAASQASGREEPIVSSVSTVTPPTAIPKFLPSDATETSSVPTAAPAATVLSGLSQPTKIPDAKAYAPTRQLSAPIDHTGDAEAIFTRVLAQSYPVDSTIRRVGYKAVTSSTSGPASRVITLDGGNRRFAALVHYFQDFLARNLTVHVISSVRQHFLNLVQEHGVRDRSRFSSVIDSYVHDAIEAGVVEPWVVPSTLSHIMLVEGAIYTQCTLPRDVTTMPLALPPPPPTQSTTAPVKNAPAPNVIRITGDDTHYAPLIQYLQKCGGTPKVQTVIKHFSQRNIAQYGRQSKDLTNVIAAAASKGFVTCTPSQPKSLVRLKRGATFVFS